MSAAAQLELFALAAPGAGPEWTSALVDRTGLAQYTIAIRAPGDPDEAIDRHRGQLDPLAWRRLLKSRPAKVWAALVLDHLADGMARTFNRIAVELTGRTADLWVGEALEDAMWLLCETGAVEHTMTAPVMWRGVVPAREPAEVESER